MREEQENLNPLREKGFLKARWSRKQQWGQEDDDFASSTSTKTHLRQSLIHRHQQEHSKLCSKLETNETNERLLASWSSWKEPYKPEAEHGHDLKGGQDTDDLVESLFFVS